LSLHRSNGLKQAMQPYLRKVYLIPHIKKHIDELVQKKWIRIDPQGGFGSTYQYKVNFDRINQDVEKIQKEEKKRSHLKKAWIFAHGPWNSHQKVYY
jgi:hypothetical protein